MRVVLSLVLVCCVGYPHPAPGQSAPLASAADSFETRFIEGLDHLEEKGYAEGIEAFQIVFDADPAYFSSEHGSIAFWLGFSLEEAGRTDAAVTVLKEGMHAMLEAGRFDVGLADAFVRTAFKHRRREHYEAAAHAFLEMLRIATVSAHPDACARIHAHIEALSWVMPPDAASDAGIENVPALAQSCGSINVQPLARWWRSQDLYPLTEENERLYEHLERFAVAADRYAPGGEPDDRARIYVRLGSPAKRISIGFNSTEFRNKVIFRHMTLNTFDFPQNEFWIYPHIDRSAQYLFVSDLGRFRLAETNDLIPAELRHGLGPTERGIRKSEALIRTLEEILRELSVLHDAYSMLYTDVADFGELLDQQELLSQAELGPNAQVDHFGADRLRVRTDLLPKLPHAFASEIINRARTEEAIARKSREEDVPASYSELHESYRPLEVDVRTARFLDPDGSTRTDVYWSVSHDALIPSRFDMTVMNEHNVERPWMYTVFVLARQYGENYRTREVRHDRLIVSEAQTGTFLEPRTLSIGGGRGTYHVAVQFDEYVSSHRDTLLQDAAGPRRLKVHVHRADTLRALGADEGRLEMSDLKPVRRPATNTASIDEILSGEALPYPYASVSPDTRLGLYFEAYHLNYGSDDRTHYDVEYEVTRTSDSPMLRLLGADQRGSISARTTQRGSSRTAREAILLDLSEWEGQGNLQITVRVTDRITGRSAERSMSFTMRS